MDYVNLMSGGMPNPFHWSVFSAGLVIGLGSYVWAARSAREGAVAPLRSMGAAQ
jgi:hypothetical protein